MQDDDGYLYIVDRLKDMIVSGGENIASSEVERVLYEHESVVEAAVVGRPDERWGEVPVAFVVVARRRDDDARRARSSTAAASSRSSRSRRPSSFIDALPRNPSGKVLKRELRDRDRRSSSRTGAPVNVADQAMRSAGTE